MPLNREEINEIAKATAAEVIERRENICNCVDWLLVATTAAEALEHNATVSDMAKDLHESLKEIIPEEQLEDLEYKHVLLQGYVTENIAEMALSGSLGSIRDKCNADITEVKKVADAGFAAIRRRDPEVAADSFNKVKVELLKLAGAICEQEKCNPGKEPWQMTREEYPDLAKSNPPPEGKDWTIKTKLRPLAEEALKYDTFDEFETAFLREIKHGRYYHVTDNPNFVIDPERGPRDMSSLAGQAIPEKGKLMITSDLSVWAEEYKGTRQYVAIIDMSQVPKEKYWQVNRGFGNELWVDDPSLAKVIKVVSVADAKRDARLHQNALEETITGSPALEKFYNEVKGINPNPQAGG